jgi:hypothetical protein
VRGQSFALVYGAFLGEEHEGRELLRSVRELGPLMDTFAMVPPEALGDMAMDPPDPLPYATAHQLLEELPPAGVDALIDAAGPGSGSSVLMLQLRHMGGALGRTAPGAGARAMLPGEVCMFALGLVEDEKSARALDISLRAVEDAVIDYRAGDYPNFVEEPADASTFFDEDTWARLRDAKAAYDPDDLFKGNHHIPPAD